jgi:putative intracellular protease/amidase
MKSVLFLVPTKDFKDLDYTEPLSVMRREGHEVTVAAEEWRCMGSMGTEVKPNVLVKHVVPDDYDALFIVGGVGARDLAVDIAVIDLIKQFTEQKKPVVGIGNGVVPMAAAGILKDRWATAAVVDEEYVFSRGPKMAHQTIVVDGNIITAVGSRVAHETGVMLANLLV